MIRSSTGSARRQSDEEDDDVEDEAEDALAAAGFDSLLVAELSDFVSVFVSVLVDPASAAVVEERLSVR